MMTYLGVNPGNAQKEMDDTRLCHARARFAFLEKLYIDHLAMAVEANVGDA